ncbi:MAG: GtrA family protein [Muribaculaceae bacterium]|nr:GtrA family protein [Muribaculaceae bacterium]
MSPLPTLQFLRFLTVGVINTLVTLIVIVLCKSVLGLNPYLSNLAGYVAGVINSFIWNKTWVFHSEGRITSEAARFLLGWGLCYSLQLLAVWALSTHTPLSSTLLDIGPFTVSGYGIATIIGMAIYTAANFIYNRTIAFRH